MQKNTGPAYPAEEQAVGMQARCEIWGRGELIPPQDKRG